MTKECKECGRNLPEDYKYDCCENCRNKRVGIIEKVGHYLLGLLAVIFTLFLGKNVVDGRSKQDKESSDNTNDEE